ncbi:PadR family transcriptional regulator [Haloplanus sp. C73]|uniref:PadR family transcriptional regulator n=1 Tax=Haloplanus sp. C73 TaxID=3421641 RepID=UPI003EBEC978
MSKWLRSGLRRDICIVVASEGEPTAQECKAALESQYGSRIDPSKFYGALETLTSKGHLTKRAEGIHDRYALTEAGEQGLHEQYEWMQDAL